jgi:monoterpene epsilon-lactone hydrolase
MAAGSFPDRRAPTCSLPRWLRTAAGASSIRSITRWHRAQKHREILEQVAAAWCAIAARSGDRPGLFGDSAGGCIAAAVTPLLRERGDPVPAALLLLSPVTDLAGVGGQLCHSCAVRLY